MTTTLDAKSGTSGSVPIEISGIFISPAHDFKGHHGKPRGEHPVKALEIVACVAGKGLVGDRYFGFKDDFIGQITFFDVAVFEVIRRRFDCPDLQPSVFRRNVITEGIDLNALISRRFRINDVEFMGSVECAPCHWMDLAVASGVEQFMKGRGGLRARITASGSLAKGSQTLVVLPVL